MNNMHVSSVRRIAYIPARGGSKGIPKKNIKDLAGVPLIAYSILAAKATGLFERIFVSTDSEEIAAIARQYGADVPFLRYAEVAQDTTKTIDTVVSDKVRLEEYYGKKWNTFVLLQPTSPLRKASDITGAVALFEQNGQSVVSISPVNEHPILMRMMDVETHRLTNILKCSSTVRRQDMPPVYRVNGAIYVNAWDELAPDLSLNDNPCGYVMDLNASVDIDAPEDLALAAELLANGNRMR